MEDIKLKNYISKLLDIQEKNKNKPLTLEELKEVALSSGIPEFEWQQMLEQADKDADIAQNHFFYKNYQESYDSALAAISINPYHTKALIVASEAALNIYLAEDKDEYLEKAEYYAKEVLRFSPAEKRAFEILAKVETFEQKEVKEKKNKYYIAAGAVVVILVIVLAVFGIKKKSEQPSNNVKNQLIEKQEAALAQWAQVENVMSRRDNLLPQLLALSSDDASVAELVSEIDDLKAKLSSSSDDARIVIQKEIQTKISELTTLVKKNNNSDELELLMVQIEGTYNRISVETKRYNDLAREYNVMLKQNIDDFPDFTELTYYQQ